MQKPIYFTIATMIIAAAIALWPQPARGQEGACILNCFSPCPAGEHMAFKQGDFDEWDGGDHDDVCFDQPCCWQTGGEEPCKHPVCASLASTAKERQDGASVTSLLEQLKLALAQSEMTIPAKILQSDGRFILNAERSSTQLVSVCTEDRSFIVAHANLPVAARDLAELRRLLVPE